MNFKNSDSLYLRFMLLRVQRFKENNILNPSENKLTIKTK